MQQAPPLDVPAKAAARERGHLEQLKRTMEPRYEAVRQVWLLAPKCSPADEGCASWKELAGKAKSMYDATRGRRFGSCGGASGKTAFVAAREQAHHAYVASLIKQLEANLGGLAQGYGSDGGEAWNRLLEEAQKEPPRPCLSPCRRPDLVDITVAVPFAKDDASLREADQSVAQALRSALLRQQGNGTRGTLIVRGHVDPGEAKGDALAEERARTVAQYLIGKGIPAADVTTQVVGSQLPVIHGGDGAANRRVDFEVVAR
ncbi:MAG: OmpA family protein [Deltaproteobacteria bacterium]|nr:OmpA family protein [Deltaproteobacteria bacterium]